MTDPDLPSEPHGADEATAAESAIRRRIVWGYVGGAALLVVAALLAWWAIANMPSSGPSTDPSASASASPGATAPASASDPTTPASSETGALPPAGDSGDAAAPPVVTGFSAAQSTVVCSDDRSARAGLTFTWETAGADEVWIGVDTSDASAQPFAAVDAASSGYTDLQFECRNDEQLYTLTARGPGGTTSSSVTVTRTLP